MRRVEQTGGRFAPFDARIDYPRHVHGRPRLEGVRAFLASRGISLPEGSPERPAGSRDRARAREPEEAGAAAAARREGRRAFEGSKRYLETARDAGLRCAVVSASTHTERSSGGPGSPGCRRAVDGTRSSPSACGRARARRPARRVPAARRGARPRRRVRDERGGRRGGARDAGFELVVGVDAGGHAAPFLDRGADHVATGLVEILERNLPPSRARGAGHAVARAV